MLLRTIKDLDYTGTPWRHGCLNFLWNMPSFDGIFWRSEMFVTGKGIPLPLFRKDEIIWIIWINVYVVFYQHNWTVKQSFFYKEISYILLCFPIFGRWVAHLVRLGWAHCAQIEEPSSPTTMLSGSQKTKIIKTL